MAKPSNEYERVLRGLADEALETAVSDACKWALDDIIEKLPLTADGVRVIPTEINTVWTEAGERRVIDFRFNPLSPRKHKNGWWTKPATFTNYPWSEYAVSECYSTLESVPGTREAAEHARKESGDE